MSLTIKSSKFRSFIERHFTSTTTDEPTIEHELQLASAALMFEMIRADDDIQESEKQKMLSIIKKQCELSEEESSELIELAKDKMHASTDYYQFTSLINEHYTQDQKRLLIRHLWELALADSVIDKYEEHLVRNLAELLHVPHAAFMQMKHQAQDSAE